MENYNELKQSIPGYADLAPDQAELFDKIYNRHYHAWGTEKRKEFTPDQIKNVKWDAKEKCIKVYYKNGDWWHYDRDGTWY